MLHCGLLTFTRLFSHVSAHQDNRTEWENLTRKEQFNCVADFGAKRVLLRHDAANLPRQQKFPLGAVCVWAGREKMTLDTGHYIRFHAHQELAREEFAAAGILMKVQFDLVDWHVVHSTLSGVPRMFQVWACKQVWGIAPLTMNSPVGQHSAHFALAACRSGRPAHTSSIVLTPTELTRS